MLPIFVILKLLTDMFFATHKNRIYVCRIWTGTSVDPKKGCNGSNCSSGIQRTFLFVSMMVSGLGAMNVCLSILAKRLNRKKTVIFFIVSFVCSLMMGYLSSRDFTQSFMNWLAQGINIISQGAFLIGVVSLHRAGLRDYRFKE